MLPVINPYELNLTDWLENFPISVLHVMLYVVLRVWDKPTYNVKLLNLYQNVSFITIQTSSSNICAQKHLAHGLISFMCFHDIAQNVVGLIISLIIHEKFRHCKHWCVLHEISIFQMFFFLAWKWKSCPSNNNKKSFLFF